MNIPLLHGESSEEINLIQKIVENKMAKGPLDIESTNDSPESNTTTSPIPLNDTNDNVPADFNSDTKLPQSLSLLFLLNGGTEALPSLALSALINDRIAIPAEYLGAYYAIAFLPYSLKPLFAVMTQWLTSARRRQDHGGLWKNVQFGQENLLVVLLVCSSLLILFTGFLEANQIVICFMVAFAKGLFISWAEFLVGLCLIKTARLASKRSSLQENESNESNTRADELDQKKGSNEEILLSLYQSQAATFRNLGSLGSHTVAFVWILVTQDWSDDADNALDDFIVTSVFVVTAIFPAIAAIIAFRHKVGAVTMANNTYQELNRISSSIEHWGDSRDFDGMSRFDSQNQFSIDDQDFASQESNSLGDEAMQHGPTTIWEGKYYDIACMFLFQVVLVMIGLRTPITSLIGDGAWYALVGTMVLSMVLILSRSFFTCKWTDSSSISHNQIIAPSNSDGELQSNELFDDNPLTTSSEMAAKTHLFRIKRVAIYLILRHAVPGTGPILYSYVYELFRSNPLYLQIMSTLGSVMAVLSTKYFEKKLASKFSSVFGIVFMIAILTTLASLWSLLYIPFFQNVQTTTTEDEVVSVTANWSVWLMILFSVYQLLGNFVGELSFMPSIILATNTLAHAPKSENEDKESNNSLDKQTGCKTSDYSLEFDDGIQYGLLISCIDFGDQLSDWFSIPIVEILGMKRENGWEHIDWYIGICSLLGILSLVSLKVIYKK
jgi:hypothetical protein